MLGWYDPELRDWFSDLVIESWFSDELVGAASTGGAVTGTLSVTLGRTTLSGSGKVTVAGALAKTLGRVTLSGSGGVIVAGSLAETLGRVSLSGTAAVTTPVVVSVGGPGMWLRDYARRRYEEEELLVLNG